MKELCLFFNYASFVRNFVIQPLLYNAGKLIEEETKRAKCLT